MASRKNRNNMNCPTCAGTGGNMRVPGAPCPNCGGAGQISGEFPFPYHYPMNLTVLQTVAGTQPTQTIPGAPTNSFQSGTNPVTLRLATEAAFRWDFNVINVSSPTIVGDASVWLQLLLSDMSGNNWPFMAAPLFANLFAGDAKLPFPHLDPLEFGERTNLQLAGYPVNYPGVILEIGIGTGADQTFAGVLNGPILPGSVVVTDPPGIITATDDGNGAITNIGATLAGTINYTTGAISVTYAVAPAANAVITVTYTQGCARIDAQFDLVGSYLRPLTDAEKAQIAQK